MIRFFKNAYRQYQHRMILRARRVARDVLLDKSDRVLEDMGFSRTLLNAGVGQWPWRIEDENKSPDITPKVEANAIRQLQAMSDRELFDLGITRGTIEESVRHGRAGIDEKQVAGNAIRSPQSTDLRPAFEQETGSSRVPGSDRYVA